MQVIYTLGQRIMFFFPVTAMWLLGPCAMLLTSVVVTTGVFLLDRWDPRNPERHMASVIGTDSAARVEDDTACDVTLGAGGARKSARPGTEACSQAGVRKAGPTAGHGSAPAEPAPGAVPRGSSDGGVGVAPPAVESWPEGGMATEDL